MPRGRKPGSKNKPKKENSMVEEKAGPAIEAVAEIKELEVKKVKYARGRFTNYENPGYALDFSHNGVSMSLMDGNEHVIKLEIAEHLNKLGRTKYKFVDNEKVKAGFVPRTGFQIIEVIEKEA